MLSVPIFNKDSGIFYDGSGHSFRLFGWNLLGVLVIMAWSAALSLILFVVLRVTKQLRVSPEIEEKGNNMDKIHQFFVSFTLTLSTCTYMLTLLKGAPRHRETRDSFFSLVGLTF